MNKIAHLLAGLALGLCLFLTCAAMLSLSSGAKIFVYQGF